jgi:Predicted transcriptional regulators
MELHEIIKQHRLEKGITQEQLAERLFITRQSISRWETGKVNPPLNALYDLSDFYNLSLEEFLGGKKIMKQSKLNLLSLLGSLTLNFFLLSTFGIFILGVWLAAWIIIIAFIFSPVILFVVNIARLQIFSWDQTVYAIILFLLGLVLFRPMLNLSKILYQIIARYFRYNISNIYYEIEE